MSKSIRKITRSLIAIALFVVVLCSIPCEAASFYSYIYDTEGEAVVAPDAATPTRNLTGVDLGVGAFKSPQDLFVYENEFYIVDTGNNRIIVTDPQFSTAKVVSTFDNNGVEDTFNGPQGICVTEDAIYVADTQNARIVKLDRDYKMQVILQDPKDETFADDFIFKPSKVSVDNHDRIFVVSSGYNLGLMQFNQDGSYLQSIGAPKVALSVFEQIRRKFQTKAMKERTTEVVPTEYSNISISEEGFIYVSSESTEEEIDSLRQLNAKGADIINRIGDPSGDIKVKSSPSYNGSSSIVDVAQVGSDGNVAILDRKRSRVFVYDNTCQLLYMFAGPGDYNGGMKAAASMVYDNNKFFIADHGKNAISVFELTDYGKMFNDIATAKKSIDYKAEEKLWGEVLAQNANCNLALNGLGNAAYKRQDYKAAMEYYKKAENRTNYSKSYAFVRRNWLENNVVFAVIVVVLAIVVFSLLSRLKKKYTEKASKDSFLGRFDYSGYVTFHPLNGYWVLKRENRGSVGMAIFWLVAANIAMIIANLFNGFIFNTNNLQTYNMLSNVVFLSLAIVLWVVAQWCVTSLMDGEGKISEIFIATCYALRPYVICNLIATVLSQVLLETEGDFYYVLTTLALVWVAMLLVTSVMQTHDYTLAKSILVIVIVLVVILLIVFIGMLITALMQQIIAFVRDIISEVTLRV